MQNDSSSIEQRSFGYKFFEFVIILISIFKLIFGAILFIFQWTLTEITAAENTFLLMTGLHTFICQFFFFNLCNIALLTSSEEKKGKGLVVSSLTTLLLYSIITYFATRIKDIFQTTFERTRTSSLTSGLIVKLIKIILEFAKATVVIVCLKEQGLHYHIDKPYTVVTFLYFICTEKFFVSLWIYLVRACCFDCLDSLEHLYVPIILHILLLCLTIVITAIIIAVGERFAFVLIASYFVLFLPLKNIIVNYVNPLLLEKRTFASFRIAEKKDLLEWNDICAVCLDNMSRARITPCNHLFHPECLKRCLQTSMKCPLCKKNFLEPN